MTSDYEAFLAHYGVKGPKWGQRNYQNEDGSYTQAGAERYWGGGHGRQQTGAAPQMQRSVALRQKMSPESLAKRRQTLQERAKEKRRRVLKIAAGVSLAAIGIAGYAAIKRNGLRRNYSFASDKQQALKIGVKQAADAAKARISSARDWAKVKGLKFVNSVKERATKISERKKRITEYKGESVQATGRYSHRDIKRLQKVDRGLTKTNERIQRQWNSERDRLIRADKRREKLSELKTKGKMAATAVAGATFIYSRYGRNDDLSKKKKK